MATGEEVLKYYGITKDDAVNFVLTNADNPELVYDAAWDSGITTQHLNDILNEIPGISVDVIKDYFEGAGLDTLALDEVRILFNANLGDLNYLVGTNDLSGVLSIEALRSQVKASVDNDTYNDFFEYTWGYQAADGVYSPDELGSDQIGSVPATHESIESLFYGTLINQYIALDADEIEQITNFGDLTADNFDAFQVMLQAALGDVPSNTIWTDKVLAELVYGEAIDIINGYEASSWIGKLDPIYLGLATMEL
ncbi:MAG: hypothetical protein LZF61_08400 [Nitrosomonas sp.]|nr:MAG: hypothetical protein LZF61_08400 [Nitrosomonas sp.]